MKIQFTWYVLLIAQWWAISPVQAQDNPVVLDDLAFVIEQPFNREEVWSAMQQFHTDTQVGIAITTVYQDDPYTVLTRQSQVDWLKRELGISLFITLDEDKAYQQCVIQVTPAVELLLPIEDRQQIQKELMEHYFLSDLTPDDACTQGLLVGIAAMEKRILRNQMGDGLVDKKMSQDDSNESSGTTLDTNIPTDSLRNNEKLKKLFLEILDEFEQDIDIWMINNGKGPLDDQVLNRLLEFSDCLPQDVQSLEAVLEIIEEYKNNPEALLDSVLQDTVNKKFIESQMANLVGPEPYRQHFTMEAWQTFKEMVCAYLKQLAEDQITYEGFVATVQGDTVKTDEIYVVNASQIEFKLTYWSKTDDIGEISYKVSLIKEGDTAEESYATDDDDKLTRNKPWTLVLEPVKEGKYTITHKIGDEDEVKHEFWVRKQHYDFACKVCGRDLDITHEKLIKLFPGSTVIEQNSVTKDYFKLAVEKAELNTCYRQAHFFSQIAHESDGMVAKEEGTRYRLKTILSKFKKSSNAKVVFFTQSFWDDEKYLEYASVNLYKKATSSDTSDKKYKSNNEKTYKWNGSSTYKVTVREGFVKSDTGMYVKCKLETSEKDKNGKRLLNLLYANGVGVGNGDVASGDGYKYRGRGAIMLTGKGNYKAISDKCNSLFGTNYDWKANPDEVKDNLKATVLSASAFVINRLRKISKLDTECTNENDYDKCVKPITKLVNGGYIGLDDRRKRFKAMIEGMFNNCKAKK